MTVTGIDYPSVRNASNTLTPELSLVISARVAPGQDAREAYEAFLGGALLPGRERG